MDNINSKIGKTMIPCSICGNEYETLVIDGHITYPHICAECMQSILEEFKQTSESWRSMLINTPCDTCQYNGPWLSVEPSPCLTCSHTRFFKGGTTWTLE